MVYKGNQQIVLEAYPLIHILLYFRDLWGLYLFLVLLLLLLVVHMICSIPSRLKVINTYVSRAMAILSN